MKLTQSKLSKLPTNIDVPRYDRNKLKGGILHIGVGNFHRSHQAIYYQDLLNSGGELSWGIRGAGVRSSDTQMRNLLSEQDWLSSVTEVDSNELHTTICGTMIDFVDIDTRSNAPLIGAMSAPETKIVSLTVTEGGYFINSATGKFDPANPNILHDIENPQSPRTAFGAILSALSKRKDLGIKPFTVMSCDNLPGNGDITKNIIQSMATSINNDLGKWVLDSVSFPNSMVDRITPMTGKHERSTLKSEFGIEDNSPVFCEPYRQWVLEDRFTNGRPELENVGAVFTDDIHSFEKMKIRILNGGHAFLAYPSALLGIEYTHEAMASPLLKQYMCKVLTDDVFPFVACVPGFTPSTYLEQVCQRFENTGIADAIERLCYDGTNRQPKFVVPSITENLAQARIPNGLALSCALWCQYCNGQTDQRKTIANNDPMWDERQTIAHQAQQRPVVWLEQKDIYGELSTNKEFVAAFSAALKSLIRHGTQYTIDQYLSAA